MSGKSKDTSRDEDPREALLRVDENEDGISYLGAAYAKTQPKLQLDSKTLEQEEEELKKMMSREENK
jgi:hypothetical protein